MADLSHFESCGSRRCISEWLSDPDLSRGGMPRGATGEETPNNALGISVDDETELRSDTTRLRSLTFSR